jgi:phage gpG-like protein
MADGDGLRSRKFGTDVTGGLKQLSGELRANKKKVTLGMLSVLQAAVKEELSTPGTGIEYRRARRLGRLKKDGTRGKSRPGVMHRASAPGSPPAPDTGKLRGSIQIEYDDLVQKGRCGTNAVQAAALNFGTKRAGAGRKTVILPRPFMEPALKKVRVAMIAGGITQLRLGGRAGPSTTVSI